MQGGNIQQGLPENKPLAVGCAFVEVILAGITSHEDSLVFCIELLVEP